MTIPTTSGGPTGPEQSSPLRSGGQFRTWFTNITTWIRGLSPAGEMYSTGWFTTNKASEAFTMSSSDWTLTAFVASRDGFDVDVQMSVTWNGAPIIVPDGGDIQNIPIGTLIGQFKPRLLGSLNSAGGGPLAVAAVNNEGLVALAALSGGANIPTGTAFTFQGMYRGWSVDR